MSFSLLGFNSVRAEGILYSIVHSDSLAQTDIFCGLTNNNSFGFFFLFVFFVFWQPEVFPLGSYNRFSTLTHFPCQQQPNILIVCKVIRLARECVYVCESDWVWVFWSVFVLNRIILHLRVELRLWVFGACFNNACSVRVRILIDICCRSLIWLRYRIDTKAGRFLNWKQIT